MRLKKQHGEICTYISERQLLLIRAYIFALLLIVFVIILYTPNGIKSLYDFLILLVFVVLYLVSQIPVFIYCYSYKYKFNKARKYGELFAGTVQCENKYRRYLKYTLPLSNARYDGKWDIFRCKVTFWMNSKKIECYSEQYINMDSLNVPYDYSCCVYYYNGKYYVDNVYVFDEQTEKILAEIA